MWKAASTRTSAARQRAPRRRRARCARAAGRRTAARARRRARGPARSSPRAARRVVRDADERGRVLRALERVGDDQRDRLARVVHDVVLQREEALARRGLAEQRRQQVRRRRRSGPSERWSSTASTPSARQRRLGVDRRDAPGGDRRADDRQLDRAGRCELGRVARRARDLRAAVDARHRRSDGAHRSASVRPRTAARAASSTLNALCAAHGRLLELRRAPRAGTTSASARRADQRGLGAPRAPRLRADAAEREPRIGHDAVAHLERRRDRDERELVRLPVAELAGRPSRRAIGAGGTVMATISSPCASGCSRSGVVAREQEEVVDRDRPRAVRAERLDDARRTPSARPRRRTGASRCSARSCRGSRGRG